MVGTIRGGATRRARNSIARATGTYPLAGVTRAQAAEDFADLDVDMPDAPEAQQEAAGPTLDQLRQALALARPLALLDAAGFLRGVAAHVDPGPVNDMLVQLAVQLPLALAGGPAVFQAQAPANG